MKKSCTIPAPQAFSNDAYPSPKDKSCYKKYTQGLAVTMQHLGPSWETLSDKVFYWPTAVADATRIVRSCRGCQFYARQTHLSAQALQTIPVTWSFVVWGLDLVGPL
jgi:hypothetical protein